MWRRTFVSAAIAVGGGLFGGCSEQDPATSAQRSADNAVPGKLAVIEASLEPGGLLGTKLVATYCLLEDPDAGFITNEFGRDKLTLDYHNALWQAGELRRLETAVTADGRRLVAFSATIDPNPRGKMSSWITSSGEDLVTECRRLDDLLQQWGGPELRLPGGPRPHRRRPGVIEELEGYSLDIGLVPPDRAAQFPPTTSDRPRYLLQSAKPFTRAVDAAVRDTTLILRKPDGSPRSVWVSIHPQMDTSVHLEVLKATVGAAKEWIAQQDPTREIVGMQVDRTRFDGRPDRLRTYHGTQVIGTNRVEVGPRPVVALSSDLDGGNPGEQTIIKVDVRTKGLPFEPERLPT
jgi:hypothetical protein